MKKFSKIFKPISLLLGMIISLLYAHSVQAQTQAYPYELSYYNFIQYDSNKINFYTESPQFDSLFSKIRKINQEGKGQIQILNIGGSHIQADIFSNQLREHFQNLNGGLNAGRGFVFPYRLAHTNTPYGYYFRYTGEWETCRNVQKNNYCNLGLGGIMAVTKDSLSSFTMLLEPENNIHYTFNRIKVLHRVDSLSFSIRMDSTLVDSMVDHPEADYTEIFLNSYIDSMYIELVQTDSLQTGFELYGFSLETDDAGFYLHNLGINGAATSSFLRCNRMPAQLKAIKPDLVIFGLGINDAYGRRFSQDNYEQNYDSLVAWIQTANPNAAIIFMSNNDSYLYRRYVNRNGEKVRESMIRLTKKHQAAFWDMYSIMGGLNSIVRWQKNGLAKHDKIHFTRPGYMLLGDMFFDAFMKSYGIWLDEGKLSSFQEVNISINQ